ncbi:hypothetical protein CW360_14055 [Pseudomonas fluvialis]|uniref:DUF3102 domain-containing protein n=1 Tax=Pseudomonas fluvialis TaxID=1793966 RepID=A0A2I0CMN4_9PSED|nr:hypothetical protein [Pseudomonas pharmacofabricae]PKF70418.1 hypothetical protein CW360_14055 [Pseudomonas pharmacofabricae]
MARTPSSDVELVADVDIGSELTAAQHQVATLTAEHEHQVRAVAAQLGYQLPADCTDPDLIQRDIAANMRRSVEACLEVGRGLRVLKEACGPGNFIDRLDALGIDRFVAAKFMQSAAKFASLGSNSALTKALGNQSKLFEMLVLDDEGIQELELTGQTGELTLDDVATMSVKELRKALRESRENLSAKERVMADITAKNNQLATELAKKPKVIVVQPVEEAKQLRQEVVATAYEVEGTLQGTLRKAFADLEKLAQQTGEDHRGFTAALVRNLEVTLMAIRSEFHLPELHPDQLPGWQSLLGLDDLAEG